MLATGRKAKSKPVALAFDFVLALAMEWARRVLAAYKERILLHMI
jgi:hypothetical protein